MIQFFLFKIRFLFQDVPFPRPAGCACVFVQTASLKLRSLLYHYCTAPAGGELSAQDVLGEFHTDIISCQRWRLLLLFDCTSLVSKPAFNTRTWITTPFLAHGYLCVQPNGVLKSVSFFKHCKQRWSIMKLDSYNGCQSHTGKAKVQDLQRP